MNKIGISRYIQSTSNAFAENKLLKVCFVIMAGLTIVNSLQLRGAITRERTIIMPTGIGYEFEISGSGANDAYFKQMARYLVNLRGSIDASNVHSKLNELLLMAHPKRHGALKDEFMRIEKEFVRYASVAQHVVLKENEQIKIKNNNKMIVRVLKERIVGNEITRKEECEYSIEFAMEFGRFWLLDIKEQSLNA